MVFTKLAFYGETSVYSKCYLVHSHNYIVKSDLQHEYSEYELTLMLISVSPRWRTPPVLWHRAVLGRCTRRSTMTHGLL